jgi:hypothetical protein
LGGFAAGWLVAGPPESTNGSGPTARGRSWLRRVPVQALAFAGLGMAADLDLLVGRHSQFTHSVGMTIAVSLGAYVVLHRAGGGAHRASVTRHAWLLALAVGAAYGSHVVLDWLAGDATPPWGITALWPFSSSYYLSHLDVFWGISREPWRPGAVWHDVLAIGRELLLLGPLALGAWWLRRPTERQILPAAGRAAAQQLPPGPRLPADGESR